MKFAMVVCDEVDVAEVAQVVERAGAKAYTGIPKLLGRGLSGGHGDSGTYPGLNFALLVAMDDLRAEQVKAALAELRARMRPHQVLRAFCWDAEQWV